MAIYLELNVIRHNIFYTTIQFSNAKLGKIKYRTTNTLYIHFYNISVFIYTV